jgi:hypothetical protein
VFRMAVRTADAGKAAARVAAVEVALGHKEWKPLESSLQAPYAGGYDSKRSSYSATNRSK